VRALAFARAVLARWDRRVVSPLPLGVVFLRRPARQRRQASPAVFSLRRDVHLHLRPQISVALVRRVQAASEAYHRSRDRTSILAPLVLRTSTAVEAQRLVERLLVRGTRIEVSTGSVEGRRSEPPRPARMLTQPPQLTVLRSDRATRDERREDQRELSGAVERSPAAADLRAPALSAAELGVDVRRLTDQVVAAIDRRLVAQAERLGRS
jgi:hypothetical protein